MEGPLRLPYKLDALHWDPQHHFNSQNRYGYAGRSRKLGDAALQCETCMQWFLARDVTCLAPELKFVSFQRNYRFCCRVCTGKEELFEVLTNTWSSIALTAIYNLLLVDGNASLGEPKRWVAIDTIEAWVKEHWGSLTHGRNLPQLLVNKALPKCLHHAHSNGELMLSQDKTEVSLRSTAPAKLKLKPLMNGTVAAGAAMQQKRERELVGNAKRKRGGGSGGRGGKKGSDSAVTAAPAQEIKLPDKYRLVSAPRVEQQHASQDACVVQLSRSARAPQIVLRDDMRSAVGHKGYRMIRATHGVIGGSWYFEVRVGAPLNGEDAHLRLGWCTEMGELQAPVGYDKNSYSYRDINGSKFHESIGSDYGEAYGPGDVIGCQLQMGEPAAAVRQRQRVLIKGVEYIVEEEVQRTVSKGSAITFYKNGVSQGVAFADVWAEVYYPAVSLYKGALVTFNFGPDFAFAPPGLDARPCCELAIAEESAPTAADARQASSSEDAMFADASSAAHSLVASAGLAAPAAVECGVQSVGIGASEEHTHVDALMADVD